MRRVVFAKTCLSNVQHCEQRITRGDNELVRCL